MKNESVISLSWKLERFGELKNILNQKKILIPTLFDQFPLHLTYLLCYVSAHLIPKQPMGTQFQHVTRCHGNLCYKHGASDVQWQVLLGKCTLNLTISASKSTSETTKTSGIKPRKRKLMPHLQHSQATRQFTWKGNFKEILHTIYLCTNQVQ